jgi:hypothetical protein
MPRTKKVTVETPIDENTSVEKPKSKRTTAKKTSVDEIPIDETTLVEKPKSKRTYKKKTETPIDENTSVEKPKSKRTTKKKTDPYWDAIQEHTEKNKKILLEKQRQEENEKNKKILLEKQRQELKQMTLNENECLSIFAHGSMDYAEFSYFKYKKIITVPKNISLVQYTRAGHLLVGDMIDIIKKNGCKSDKEEVYNRYYVIGSDTDARIADYRIAVETAKPIIIKPLTEIQNISLGFEDKMLNLGIYKNNKFNQKRPFGDLNLGNLPEEKIEILTKEFINKHVDLGQVLESMSKYISEKYGEKTIVKVHLFSCRVGNYLYTEKNRKTDITDAEMDDLAREFGNIDIKTGYQTYNTEDTAYKYRFPIYASDNLDDVKKYVEKAKKGENTEMDFYELYSSLPEKIRNHLSNNFLKKNIGLLQTDERMEIIKKKYPKYYNEFITKKNAAKKVNRIPNPQLDDMAGGAKKTK